MPAARGRSPTLLQRAVAMLARREHSRAELAQKLARHLSEDADPAQIDAVLDQLEAKGMLSDQRFAAALVARRGARFGLHRIRHELRQSGVDGELLQSSLTRLKQTELVRARSVLARKFGAVAADPAERARQMRFLAGRGFSTEVILQVVKGADAGATD